MPKKINPNRRPASQADVEKAYRQGRADGTRQSLTVSVWVLRDKCGWGKVRITRFLTDVFSLCEDIVKGQVPEKDVNTALLDEYGIGVQ